MLSFRDRLQSEDDLRALVKAPPPDARPWQKEIPALDDHCRAFIAHSPYLVLATAGPDGRCDASPRGGPSGFVKVLDAVALDGSPPALAFGMVVETAFIHCAKALLRSRLWSPEDWLELDALPPSAAMLRDHVSNGVTLEGVEEALRESYRTTLWWRQASDRTGSR